MDINTITLKGEFVRMEPLSLKHHDGLVKAATDGELWNSKVTIIPSPDSMAIYIRSALDARAQKREVPFVIVHLPSGQVVGTTRYCAIEPEHRKLSLCNTWMAASWQRTIINTEVKFLALRQAFEVLNCVRVGFITDAINQAARAALVRIGAKQEGILRQYMIMPDGRRRDSVCYSIIDADWPGVRANLVKKLARNRIVPSP